MLPFSPGISVLYMYISYIGTIGFKCNVPPSFNLAGIGTTKRRTAIAMQIILIILRFVIITSLSCVDYSIFLRNCKVKICVWHYGTRLVARLLRRAAGEQAPRRLSA